MDNPEIKVIAMDLDGTLTQHKTELEKMHRDILDQLCSRYRLLMVGAGQCLRIFRQMNRYPVDIIGNYGMQYGKYDPDTNNLKMVFNISIPYQKKIVTDKITVLRETLGLETFLGATVEFHDSGCITFPLLGTGASLDSKLAFDPDRKIRRRMFPEVSKAFPAYTVCLGGSSSFDIVPLPYDKFYALDQYCRSEGLKHQEILYIGDDYGAGGNDEAVYRSDFPFLKIDDYREFPDIVRNWLASDKNPAINQSSEI